MADTRRYVYIAFFTVNVYIKKGRILYILHFKISVSDIYFPHRIGNSYFWPIKCQASLISEFQWSITHADLDLLSNGLSTCIATKPQKLLFCNEGKMCSVSDYRRSNLKKREEGKKKKGRRKNGKFGSFFYETVILQGGGRTFYVYKYFFRICRSSFCEGILEVR